MLFYCPLFCVVLGIIAGANYISLRGRTEDNVGNGISIATFIVGVPTLIMAFYGMGEYAGLGKSDSFSWAYDTADDAYAFENYGKLGRG